MALARRRDRQLSPGEFRVRVYLAVFGVAFVLAALVAMVRG